MFHINLQCTISIYLRAISNKTPRHEKQKEKTKN